MAARRILAIAALGMAATGIAVAIALAREGQVNGEEPEPAVRVLALRPLLAPGARVVEDGAHALRVRVPPGWRLAKKSLLPGLAHPESSILAVATFRPRAQPRRACGSWHDMPQVPVGPRDALLHVEEQLEAQPGTLPRRPARFRLLEQTRVPGLNEPVRSVFPWRCLNRAGIAGLRESFRAHGRLMHVTAVAGERTSKRTRRRLLGVLASLRFGPPAPLEVTVRPNPGRPGTRFRLGIVGGHPTGRSGRRERSYRASVHGPHRVACVIEHEAWFSHGPPGARLDAVLDPRRTKGGRWCRGRFRGVLRYRDAICPRRADACWRVYARRAGRFEYTVR